MITHLSLNHYRNFSSCRLAFSKPHVVLYGENGVGKSNILEAVSLFSIGKGLKKASPQDILSQENEKHGWSALITLDDQLVLKTGFYPEMNGELKKKSFIQDDIIKNHTCFSEWINVLWITPETDQLFLDTPSVRRKFIDRFVYAQDVHHLKRVLRFEHAIRERMKILKQFSLSQTNWLDALEETIVEEGLCIYQARKKLLDSLSLFLPQKSEEKTLHPFQAYMFGDFETCMMEQGDDQHKELYIAKLKHNRSVDMLSGKTIFGPHRSDLKIDHPIKKMDVFQCSTGEQKVLLLSLLIAFIEKFCLQKESLTVFLLDDVIAHLDFDHRSILFNRLTNHESKNFQAWFSGTDRSFFENLHEKADFFDISKI